MIGVIHILAQALGVLALAMLPPAAVSLAVENGSPESYLVTSGLTGFLSGALFFAFRGRGLSINRPASFVLATAIWSVPPFVAAVPIAIENDLGYLPALFEAVSGLTTTGATVFGSLAGVPASTILWRAELQWLGGVATLITFATILAPAGLGGLSTKGLATVGRFGAPGRAHALDAIRGVFVAYSALSLICLVMLILGGVGPLQAFCLAMSAISTGGFMPVDGGLAVYGSGYVTGVVALFMAIGATSIVWQRLLVERRMALLAEHREAYWVVATMLGAGLLYAWTFRSPEAPLAALGEGIVNGISLVSTSGFDTRPDSLSAIPDTVAVVLALFGAAALSSAGGLKLYRIGAMTVQSLHELKRLVFPHSVRSTRFGSQPYDLRLMKAIWSNLAVALTLIGLVALLLALSLPTFDSALIAAVSAFSNIGPLYSAGGPWPGFGAFDPFAKSVMIVTMILGRVEVIVLFATFSVVRSRT